MKLTGGGRPLLFRPILSWRTYDRKLKKGRQTCHNGSETCSIYSLSDFFSRWASREPRRPFPPNNPHLFFLFFPFALPLVTAEFKKLHNSYWLSYFTDKRQRYNRGEKRQRWVSEQKQNEGVIVLREIAGSLGRRYGVRLKSDNDQIKNGLSWSGPAIVMVLMEKFGIFLLGRTMAHKEKCQKYTRLYMGMQPWIRHKD